MKRTQFTIGEFGIIFDDKNRVLLCHRCDYDLWNLPGGGLEAGESPWEGVIREVKEETGFDVEVMKLSGIYSKPDKDEVVFSFICKIIDGHVLLNDEADKIEYFAIDALPPNTAPKQVERIKDALVDSGTVVLKIQTGKSSIELVKEGKLKSL